MINRKEWEFAVIANDIHFPYHDPKAVELFLLFLKKEKPDVVFLNGDLIDCWVLSRFPKPPDNNQGRQLSTELEMLNEFLRTIRRIVPKARIVYIFGNHEHRFKVYLINAPGLYGLNGTTLEDQIDKSLDIEIVYSGLKESYIKYGALYVGHWDKASKHSAASVKSVVEDKAICAIQGHCHRMGSYYKTVYGGDTLVGYENGCLCTLKPDWTGDPNWQHGFSVVYKKKNKDRFHLYQIPIVDYQFFYGGHLFKV